jgi:hypothetical protein
MQPKPNSSFDARAIDLSAEINQWRSSIAILRERARLRAIADPFGVGDHEREHDRTEGERPMTTMFKMRAEFMMDVGKLLTRIYAERVEIKGGSLHPDCDLVVTLTNPWIYGRVRGDRLVRPPQQATLETLRSEIAKIDGAHVMLQTVAPLAEYTGEREYESAPALDA